MPDPRYHRQLLLPQIGAAGQEKLARSRVLLVGVGALGCTIADQLVRAGAGHLRLVDRDLVDVTNLHRQTLFTEKDARAGAAKAAAAAARLREVNSAVEIEPIVADVHAANVEELAGLGAGGGFRADLILDGTDNAETRYLINDVCVKHGIPWVYGACVGVEARVMGVAPGETPCLRCVFPQPPAAGELQTCDTAGVLGAAAAAVAAMQAAMALRLLVQGDAPARLMAMNVWDLWARGLELTEGRDADCIACGRREFEFLARPPEMGAAVLCGREAVQVRGSGRLDLAALAERLRGVGEVQTLPLLLRLRPTTHAGLQLTVFADGRTVVEGTRDAALARSVVARYIGA
jgi:adenylyltransferase/sulfurtransferase